MPNSQRHTRRGRLFNPIVRATGLPDITTEIAPAGTFFYAEDYHQQYLSVSTNRAATMA